MEGNLLYLKSTNLNVNLIQKILMETFWITSGHCGPAQWHIKFTITTINNFMPINKKMKEMHQFLKTHKLPKLNQDEMENLNSPVNIK